MAKVTSKLQVTLPKALADAYDIAPGDDIQWEAAGRFIRVVPRSPRELELDREARLRLFDAATARQHRRGRSPKRKGASDRGWTRDELYDRGRAR